MTEDLSGEMRERFGDQESDEYIALAKAMRGYVHVWLEYVAAPIGSLRETQSALVITQMSNGLKANPGHAAAIVEGMTALILHMRAGGTYEEWFLSLGLSPVVGEDEKE